MGKEITNSSVSRKNRIVTDSIEKAVDQFLVENYDRVGYALVEAIYLTGDLRQANIFIRSANGSKVIDFLEKNKMEVSEKLKSLVNSRYMPRLNFKEGANEIMDF